MPPRRYALGVPMATFIALPVGARGVAALAPRMVTTIRDKGPNRMIHSMDKKPSPRPKTTHARPVWRVGGIGAL